MKRLLTFLLLFSASTPAFCQVTLNEILASNAINLADPDFQNFSDWVELYNAGSQPMDISGWFLSDDNDLPQKWAFPAGTTIAAGGYLLVWADGENTGLHTGFKLSADGEKVFLTESSGNEIDRIEYGPQKTDISLGRSSNGGGTWGYFTKPTPGASNTTSTFYSGYIEAVPVFSKSGGFFDNPLTINIENLTGAGTLRYTLDGSNPTNASPEWTAALAISTTKVVKARLFAPDMIPGPIVTNTYFIGENMAQRHMPVMSISTHPDYFFAADSGIYVQSFKPDWEIPVHLEFYEPDGLLGFHHDAGASIGGENAWILPEKLLNISSRKQYGSSKIAYQLFPNNPRKEFEDVILRCSGNDWSNTLFRDGMEQGLAASTAENLDIQDFRPCIVYINGAYFGIHNIREKQDKEYTAIYHNIDADSLDYIENDGIVKEGNVDAYHEMVNLLTAGVSSNASFSALESMCDTRNFTDYIISQIFTANTSWGHNIALFRKRSPGSKWRWFPHDYDRGFDLGNLGSTAMGWATATNGADWTNPAWGTLFLRKMLENNDFKTRFITRFADHLFVTYNPQAVNKRVDKHANWIRSEMPYHVARWAGTTSSYGNGIPSVAFWENEVAKLRDFAQQRNVFMFNDLNQYFSLSGATALKIQVSPDDRGWVRIHDLQLPEYPWSGSYLKNWPFTLTAEAKPGFNFVRWEKTEDIGAALVQPSDTWHYYDGQTAPPANWNQTAFDASGWQQGNAEFGYGDGDETTVLDFGPNSNNKTIAYYFQKKFTVPNAALFSGLTAKLVADDGAVVYLNGNEVWRYNMPGGAIDFTTLATTAITNGGESAWNEQNIQPTALQSGENTISIEIHQSVANSSDISFNFQLTGLQSGNVVTVSTNPVLEYTLGDNPENLRAVFESDGTCGILPDTVRNNLTLTAACSPYRADADVVVLPNVTLTAEPGVEILFPEKNSLWVHGNLAFNGSQNAPVVVKSLPGQGAWGGILLENTTSASNIQYLRLENASSGTHRLYFPAAISAYHADLNLDHITITDVTDNPIYARFSNVKLTNSTIKSSVTGDCINIKNGFGWVENNVFSSGASLPDMDAVDYDGVVNGIVRNNVIHDFRGDNNDGLDIGEECQNLIIEHNFIYHCLDKGISVGQRSSASIQNNVIAYTGYGIALKDQSPVTIDHCTFFGSQNAVAAYEKNAGNLGGNGVITNCIASNIAFGSFTADTHSSLIVENTLTDTDTLGGANLQANPFFVNPTWYNFQLMPNSPAIGAATNGSNLGATPLPTYTGQPQLMFSEILYYDTLTTTGEFVEILNPGTQTVDLQGYTIANALDFAFPAGASIAPGEYIVVAHDAANFTGAPFQVFQWDGGKLADEGEALHLFDGSGILVDFVRFDNHAPWPERSTLLGKSLELVSEDLDDHFATSWKPSAQTGGTPGAPASVGTHELGKDWSVEIFPNPATEHLNVQVIQDKPGFWVKLMDVAGKTVREKAVQGQQTTLNLTGIAPGFYFVAVYSQSGILLGMKKVAVE